MGIRRAIIVIFNDKLYITAIILFLIAIVGLLIYKLIVRGRKMKNVSIPITVKNTEEKIAENKEEKGLSFGNAQHIGSREEQQDSFGISDISDKRLVMEKGILAVVADGMGGLANGREASNIVTETMLDEFTKPEAEGSMYKQLLGMVNLANTRVYEGLASGKEVRSGSTVVSVAIKDCQLYWISVGDSRIYLYRNNKITQLTKDHNYGTKLDEEVLRGRLSYSEALNNPDRKALTSYIGDPFISEIDNNLNPLILSSGDKIILCSDGIYGSVSEKELEEIMINGAQAAADETINRILLKNLAGQDNMTIIVIGID